MDLKSPQPEAQGVSRRSFLKVGAASALAAGLGDSKLEKQQPVGFTAMPSNTGWMLSFQIPEPAHSFRIAVEGSVDRLVQQPVLALPRGTRRCKVLLAYTTANGQPRGPIGFLFDPEAEAVRSTKNILAMLGEWVAFREWDGKTLVYFTTLLCYRFAFRVIRFSVDDTPPRDFPFQPADPAEASAEGVGDGPYFIEVPGSTREVTVRLEFLDGTFSEPHRVGNPEARKRR